MNNFSFEIRQLLNNFDLNKGDTVMMVSDISNILLSYKKDGKIFDVNLFLDLVLEHIGHEGTLLIPTYNYDFCNGITFDYLNTQPITGTLGKIALKRKDFKRTKNPIHSFVVGGKDKELLYNLKHQSSFGNDSPFKYLHEKNAKYFSIGLNFTNLGFTPAHYVEEKVGVSYRYIKNFSGYYIDENGLKNKVNYKFYVRDRSKSAGTGIKRKTSKLLSNINAYDEYFIKKEIFGIVKLGKALNFLIDDMKNNHEKERLIYPIKKDAKITRVKINTAIAEG